MNDFITSETIECFLTLLFIVKILFVTYMYTSDINVIEITVSIASASNFFLS